MVRARGHYDWELHPVNRFNRNRFVALNDIHHLVRIGHCRCQLTVFLKNLLDQPVRFDFPSVKSAQHILGKGGLGHGPVIGPMPALIFSGMKGSASIGGHVLILGVRLGEGRTNGIPGGVACRAPGKENPMSRETDEQNQVRDNNWNDSNHGQVSGRFRRFETDQPLLRASDKTSQATGSLICDVGFVIPVPSSSHALLLGLAFH